MVSLLNDFQGQHGIQDEVFLDEYGEPTDRFLEALKASGVRSGKPGQRSLAGGREEDAELDLDDSGSDYYSRSSSIKPKRNGVYQSRRHIEDDRSRTAAVRKSRDLSRSIDKKRGSSSSVKSSGYGQYTLSATGRSVVSSHTNDNNNNNNNSRHASSSSTRKNAKKSSTRASREKLVVKQKPDLDTRSTRGSELRARRGVEKAIVAESKSKELMTGKGAAFSARAAARMQAQQDSHRSTAINKSSTFIPGSIFSGQGEKNERVDIEVLEEVEMAAETRSRTMQLRLSGQQSAIKSLEGQLAETMGLLEGRNRQLLHAESRVKAMQKELERETKKASMRVQENERIVEEKRGDLLDKCKAHNELLSAQLFEEQTKRRRADDRVRVLREYSEKSKARVAELEQSLADLMNTANESKQALLKSRSDVKNLTSENATKSTSMEEKDEEISRQKARAENAEYAARNHKMDSDRLREELRIQRQDLLSAYDQHKQTQMELELVRQRYAARNAEQSIVMMKGNNTSQVSTGVRAPSPNRSIESYDTNKAAVHENSRSNRSRSPAVSKYTEDRRREMERSYSDDNRIDTSIRKGPSRDHSFDDSSTSRSNNVLAKKASYSLPSRGVIGRSPAETSMSRRAAIVSTNTAVASSYIYDDDDESENESDGNDDALPPPPPHHRNEASADVRRSTNSLESVLLTQNLGLEDLEEEDEGSIDSIEKDRGSSLRRLAEDMQGKAKARADAADASIRSSIDSQRSAGEEPKLSALSASESLVMEKFNKFSSRF